MEIIKLNLIPSGVNPTCHCSQYDEGRVIRIELFDGLTPYTLQSGDTVTLNVRKPDNTIVTTTVETTQGNNYVEIVTTEQICACVGYNLCDLTITNGSKVIGTLNFIMAIERDVLADGIESQSVIEDLDERVAEAVGDNYYTKEETEELIDNELKDVYPLGEASGAIASFNTDVILPLKSLTAEIKATETGSGEKSPSNPYTINGFNNADVYVVGKNRLPTVLEDIKANNTGGVWNGDSYTQNGVTFTLVKNALGEIINVTVNGTATTNTYFYINRNLQNIIANDGSMKFGGCSNGSATTYAIQLYYDSFPSSFLNCFNNFVSITASSNKVRDILIVIRNGYTASNLKFYPMVYAATETDLTFEAYKGTKTIFDFGQTVYGGSFDDKGNLVVTHGIVDLGSLTWTYHAPSGDASAFFDTLLPSDSITGDRNIAFNGLSEIYNIIPSKDIALSGYDNNVCALANATRRFITCDTRYTDATSYKNAMNGVMLVYELATPIVIAIDKKDIYTLLNENNIFTTTNGNVDVIYHHALTAKNIYFDNTGTTLQADNVEDAIKEILTLIQGGNNSRALNLSKGSLKTETPVSNEEPVKAEELTTEEEPEAISDIESEPLSDEER
jgi:hypothetical protein